MDASFWTRARPIGVGLLTDDTATDAIAKPLASEGISLVDEHLWQQIVDDSQRYPYFVQAWGDELWNQGVSTDTAPGAPAAAHTALSKEDVDAARRNVARLKDGYYADRYEELAKEGLLAPARMIARRFADGCGPCSWQELADIIEPSVEPGSTSKTLRELAHAGFVWRPPDENDWGPGIPSLMNYVPKGDLEAPMHLQVVGDHATGSTYKWARTRYRPNNVGRHGHSCVATPGQQEDRLKQAGLAGVVAPG